MKICPKINCKKAGVLQPFENFSRDKSTKNGFKSNCKACVKEYHFKIKDRKAETARQYELTHKEKRKEQKKQYFIDNKKEIDEYNKQWRLLNTFKIAKNQKERFVNDVQYRLACQLRGRMSKAVRGDYKSGSAVGDAGCTMAEFKKHLELKIYPNLETGEAMSWDNYGKYGWHIDHIRPLSSFDLTNREQSLQAAHYSNQQPLWWKDNLQKSDNY